MLDFIWHLRGSIALSASDAGAEVLDRVEQLLIKQHKPFFDRGVDQHVSFDSPLWTNSASNWAAMLIYDRGKLWISQEVDGRRLRYDLRSLQAFILCVALAAIAFGFVALDEGVLQAVIVAGLVFGWLYGGNLCLALVRVPFLLRQTARSVG
jgi:hypothetical protein